MRYALLSKPRRIQKLTFIFVIKSIAIHKIDLTSFFISETTFKSRSFHKFNLSTFIIVESIIFKVIKVIKLFLSLITKILIISFLIYRAISSSSLIYEIIILKIYFTIVDLYIRYTSLSKFQTYNKITRIMIVFFIIFIINRNE